MADDAAAPAGGVRLCDGAELAEKGRARVFDVLHLGAPARAFALRHGGRVVAYLNRCAHQPVELDWQEGRFLSADGETIVCAMHGAEYAPASGACLGGPCGRGRLAALSVEERREGVYWYPSCDIRPVAFDPEAGHESTA